MSEIGERVKKIVVEHLGVEPEKVVDNASFIDDLGADSLDTRTGRGRTVHRFLVVGGKSWAGVLDMRRVVVTGLGMVSPLGCGVEPTWKRILNSESGAKKIDTFDVSDLTSRIACVVPRGDGTDGTFNPDQWMEPKDQRKVDDFIIFAMCAARQALDDANWHPATEEDRCATGTMIGSGIGGLSGIADTAIVLKERGPRKVSPFFIPGRLINLASGYVSIEHGLKGPNHAVVTACSTGAHAIRDASRLIALGDADVMVAGGTESPICRIGMAGFCAARALSTGFNEAPERASRPYDRDRRTATARSAA